MKVFIAIFACIAAASASVLPIQSVGLAPVQTVVQSVPVQQSYVRSVPLRTVQTVQTLPVQTVQTVRKIHTVPVQTVQTVHTVPAVQTVQQLHTVRTVPVQTYQTYRTLPIQQTYVYPSARYVAYDGLIKKK